MVRVLLPVLFVLLVLAACSRTPAAVLDVSGVWQGEAVTEYVTTPLRLELQQNGSALTGTVTTAGAPAPELVVTGQVDAPNVSFSYIYDLGSIGGGANVVARYVFSGAVANNTLSGELSVSVDGAGAPVPGTFSFQKQP